MEVPVLAPRIEQEIKDAARARNAARLTVLRALKSAMMYREIELGKPLDAAAELAVCAQQIKQRRDAAAQFTAGGRPELASNEVGEIAVLETFLPKQLTDEELSALVRDAVAESGAKDPKGMGGVMKLLTPRIQGRADGKRVSEAVKKALAG
jgi:uncharacterized protein YqeY